MVLRGKSLSTYIRIQDLIFDKLLDIYKMQNAQLKEIVSKKKEGVDNDYKNHFNYLMQLQQAVISLQKEFEKVKSFSGLIDEGGEMVLNVSSNPLLRDAALIMSAHIVNENELKIYNALIEVALKNGQNSVYALLKNILTEECEHPL